MKKALLTSLFALSLAAPAFATGSTSTLKYSANSNAGTSGYVDGGGAIDNGGYASTWSQSTSNYNAGSTSNLLGTTSYANGGQQGSGLTSGTYASGIGGFDYEAGGSSYAGTALQIGGRYTQGYADNY
jgi:hypothetical protein